MGNPITGLGTEKQLCRGRVTFLFFNQRNYRLSLSFFYRSAFRSLDTYAHPWVQHIGVHGAVLYDDSSGGAVGGIQGVDVVVALDVAFASGGLSGGFFGGGWGLLLIIVVQYRRKRAQTLGK